MQKFELVSNHAPAGDQVTAIEQLVNGINNGDMHQVLLGATGTGKTFTIANVLLRTNKSAIILSHNKTLAGQLYAEIKALFPKNRVEYFISNFDYYRPEAYMPSSDTYIDKTSKSNWDIEAMRMSTTNALLTDEPVIVVASVASIYGQMAPLEYRRMFMEIRVGQVIKRSDFFIDLAQRNYVRNPIDLKPGTFRAKGDVIDIAPATTDQYYYRIEMFGNEIEGIKQVNYLTGEVEKSFKKWTIMPANSYTTSKDIIEKAVETIRMELEERLAVFKKEGKLLEAQRLEDRTRNDIDSLKEFGVVSGIENYSRHLDGRSAGEKPYTILDYLLVNAETRGEAPLLIIDESHMMIPQLHAMYEGDRSRKSNLVEYGFRLPSALDNRPLKFSEFDKFPIPLIYVSATPAEYELDKAHGVVVSQIVRPTGLLDPTIEVVGTAGQVEDIYDRIQKQKANKERTFILTTTKRMAEELARYLQERNERIAYLHSDHKTFERDEILRKLRLGVFDTVIGVNLIREGIDIPEISLVLVLDADKESFFRSTSSLIQIVGRAARNEHGHVVLYGDTITKSMQAAISETSRRREIQMAYNKKHHIVPKTIVKAIPEPLNPAQESGKSIISQLIEKRFDAAAKGSINEHKAELLREIASLKGRMLKASRELDFERAAQLRDLILEIESMIE